jgi:hypothetical protein
VVSRPARRRAADAGGGPPRGAVPRGTRGAVYVEFLLVFIPVFTLFLAVLQLGLMYAAKLVTQHAATTASRAAAVIVDDDPARYQGGARGRLDPTGRRPRRRRSPRSSPAPGSARVPAIAASRASATSAPPR